MRLRVQDVMTAEVVAVRERTPFRDLVLLLRKHRVSALPVVDGSGRVLGVVSESDLFLKQVEPLRDGHGRLLEGRHHRTERVKAAGATAAELMTTPAITVGRDQPATQAARRMHDRGVKRLPVVNGRGVLVGIVTRGDLLKAYLRPDQEIRAELTEAVLPQVLERWFETVQVQVDGGVVRLTGHVTDHTQALALVARARAVDGVVSVASDVTYDMDDTSDWTAHPRLPTT